MADIFVISDLHLNHANILTFTKNDGTLLREFRDVDHMNQTIITNWNAVVNDRDKVYVLGDVAFGRKSLDLIRQLKGKKRLVRGNHDLAKISEYVQLFEEVYGVRQLNRVWLTHVPMHESCVNQERVMCNVHGHLHANVIDHLKYVNVCVEQVNYTPVNLEEIRHRFADKVG